MVRVDILNPFIKGSSRVVGLGVGEWGWQMHEVVQLAFSYKYMIDIKGNITMFWR